MENCLIKFLYFKQIFKTKKLKKNFLFNFSRVLSLTKFFKVFTFKKFSGSLTDFPRNQKNRCQASWESKVPAEEATSL